MAIREFSFDNAFLSNFPFYETEYTITLPDGSKHKRKFPTSEHAYQAAKATTLADINKVMEAGTAGQSKRAGRAIKLRSDWDSVRWHTMAQILIKKFGRNAELIAKLDATGNQLLVEGNHWQDCYWGRDVKQGGKNWLGIQLMALRYLLRTGRFGAPADMFAAMNLIVREEWGPGRSTEQLVFIGAVDESDIESYQATLSSGSE